MKSWKTTLSGAISSGAGLVFALSQAGVVMPKWLVVTAIFIMAGGFAGIGVFSKDASVHSTSAEVQTATTTATREAIAESKPISTVTPESTDLKQ